MAFTNVYDDNFPPDTQLANQLGLDLRNFRLDTQQRMAAISGLDAAKPAFGADAQPANWNGILFFATDSGKIYQFNNPNWTDVTSTFLGVVVKNSTIVIQTGNGSLNTVYTLALPALNVASQLRVNMLVNTAGPSDSTVKMSFGGTTVFNVVLPHGSYFQLQMQGGNFGATNAQTFAAAVTQFTTTGSFASPNMFISPGSLSAIDTTVGQNLLIQAQGALISSVRFYGVIVEIL